jgi:hypothetical protein
MKQQRGMLPSIVPVRIENVTNIWCRSRRLKCKLVVLSNPAKRTKFHTECTCKITTSFRDVRNMHGCHATNFGDSSRLQVRWQSIFFCVLRLAAGGRHGSGSTGSHLDLPGPQVSFIDEKRRMLARHDSDARLNHAQFHARRIVRPESLPGPPRRHILPIGDGLEGYY